MRLVAARASVHGAGVRRVCLAGCGVVEAVGGELPVVMHAGNLAFGVLLLVALVLERMIMRRGETTVDGRWILAAAGSLGLAFAIWNTAKDGSPLCWPESVYQGHGVWHLLCALAAYCLFRFWASEQRARGSSGQRRRATVYERRAEERGRGAPCARRAQARCTAQDAVTAGVDAGSP